MRSRVLLPLAAGLSRDRCQEGVQRDRCLYTRPPGVNQVGDTGLSYFSVQVGSVEVKNMVSISNLLFLDASQAFSSHLILHGNLQFLHL